MSINMDVDLFILGGGINGVGIAAEASSRNLSVILCEKNDLASGTSSASSKLIHGGVRYLEQYNFKLVHQSLVERKILMHRAKHLARPLKFILPFTSKLRPAWMIRFGLFLYDRLSLNSQLPSSKKISLKKNTELKNKFKSGFEYYDCLTDDARLVITNAQFAAEHGAHIFTRTRCTRIQPQNNHWDIQLFDTQRNEIINIRAKIIINATGPWIQQVHDLFFPHTKKFPILLDAGSHIVIPKLYPENYAYILQNPDQRIIFTIPFEEYFTLIGTTDIPFSGNPEQVQATPDEIEYLCQCVNHYFSKQIIPTDCLWSFAGLRVLFTPHEDSSAAKISREYHIDIDESSHAPLMTIIGGKLTTYRKLAEEVLLKLNKYFPNLKPSTTKKSVLPGGVIKNNYLFFLNSLIQEYSFLPASLLKRYARQYGSLTHKLLIDISEIRNLGERFGADLYQKEVDYLIDNEWAQTAEDILWRRTKLGLAFNANEIEKLQLYMKQKIDNLFRLR